MDKHIKNIVFDFGGVLLDWNPHYVYDGYFGSTEKATYFIKNICTIEWNGLVDKGVSIEDANQLLIAQYPEWEKEILMYFDRWIEMIGGPIDDTYQLMKQLKAMGYPFYGLSNFARQNFVQIQDSIPALKLLEGYILSSDVKMLKPEPAIYKELLRQFKLKADECLFIDDNLNNVEAARQLGFQAIQFVSAQDLGKQLGL